MMNQGKKLIQEEAQFFSDQNNQLTRSVAWNSIPYFQKKFLEAFDIKADAKAILSGRKNISGLTLACGDMTGEYKFLTSLGVEHIDAYDISEGQREKFYQNYDHSVEVNYQIEDVNNVVLPERKYDIVCVQQAYHHLSNVYGVAEEISKSLKDDGIFTVIDYIGAPFLQRTQKQEEYASKIWKILPSRLRKNHKGIVLEKIHIPPKSSLSPYEAINSDEIMSAFQNNFIFIKELKYGGILFPIFNGFSQNYTTSEEDLLFIKTMWETDQFLIKTNAIEPNFIRAIMKPRK
ncbi:MAG: methyltransferase domain-containing protein [Microcoleaceae cyanobacterium]